MFFKPKFDLDAKTVKEDMEQKDIFLLDVRTPQEYQEGYIQHAHNIPVTELEQQQHKIPKDVPIYLYCRSGQRANTAKRKLQALGYRDVYNFGGVIQWPYDLVK